MPTDIAAQAVGLSSHTDLALEDPRFVLLLLLVVLALRSLFEDASDCVRDGTRGAGGTSMGGGDVGLLLLSLWLFWF